MKKVMVLVLGVLLGGAAGARMVITEWMYSGVNGEFVEFTNVGTTSVDMTGWSFDDNSRTPGSVDLSAFGLVSPGESVILTEADAAAFRTAWGLGASVKIIGNLTHNLGRNDEINLYDAGGVLIARLTYGDQDFPGTIRTQNTSGNVPSSDFDKQTVQASWVLSSVGDSYNSRQSAGGDIGNPGFYPLAGTVIPVGGLIVNEYSAVGSEKYLGSELYADANEVDVYFQALADGKHPGKLTGVLPNGRIQGNGSDWIELVVTRDGLDIRGWEIRWAETDKIGAPEADGTDIWYGDGMVEQGILKFSNHPVWSNLRAGTILTLVQEHTIYVDTVNGNRTYQVAPGQTQAVIHLGTDLSFNPAAGDWWLNVSVRQEAEKTDPNARLVTSVHNVLNHAVWDFGVGNDNWEARIVDAAGRLIWGPVGEHLGPQYWGGAGLSSTEVARLEADPSASVTGASFDDASSSSFGMANRWAEMVQNFRLLRGPYRPADCYETLALGYGSPLDVNRDCRIDLTDFAGFASVWMKCVDPEDASCSTPWAN
ncbi:MAG TPA: lamin tail domain-containing protein [Anaerohalosphaeraceae bacterium]|nr:lamin tail domain-containing protein [Anaerohalosphaeraceae bacterium]